VVPADVLDAWFPPAPSVVEALRKNVVDLCRTSPEVHAGPLTRAISMARRIPEDCIVAGAGSSALIYMALPLLADGRVALVLDPTYGEYANLLAPNRVERLRLNKANSYLLDPANLQDCSAGLVILVNPNSPTGQFIPRKLLEPVVRELAERKLVWIDETYIEYAGPDESLEQLACQNPNVVVCKSMSKVYALSGLRVAYLVAHPTRVARFTALRPPWAVSLPAQVCGAAALLESSYYATRYNETADLRSSLGREVESIGLNVTMGVINCILVHLPEGGATAREVAISCATHQVFLRDACSMGETMGSHTLRISVRDARENSRIVEVLKRSIGTCDRG